MFEFGKKTETEFEFEAPVATIIPLKRNLTEQLYQKSNFTYYIFSGVILPTLNLFIRSIHGDKSVIGLCVSAISFTGLLSAPVFGRVTDYVGKPKLLS